MSDENEANTTAEDAKPEPKAGVMRPKPKPPANKASGPAPEASALDRQKRVKVKIQVTERVIYGRYVAYLEAGKPVTVPEEIADWLVHTSRGYKA